MISGALRSGSPRRTRLAICSAVKPSAVRSAFQAASMSSSSLVLAACDSSTANRHGWLWCGRRRGDRRRDGPADRRGDTGAVRELPDGPPGRQHVGGTEPEHVLLGWPDDRGRARSGGVGDQVGQAAYDRDRDAGRLLLDQVGGRGDLVGDGSHRDLEQVPERVGLAAMVAQRRDPGRADRGVGLAGSPWPAHRVGDDHPEPDACPLADGLAQPLGRAIRVDGQQDQGARLGVGLIDARRGQHQAMPGLADRGRTAARDDPDRLGPDRLFAVADDDAVLGLADDLRGDDQDVAIEQARTGQRGVGDQRGQVGACGDLG